MPTTRPLADELSTSDRPPYDRPAYAVPAYDRSGHVGGSDTSRGLDLGTGVRVAIAMIVLALLLGAIAIAPALASSGPAAVCLVCPLG